MVPHQQEQSAHARRLGRIEEKHCRPYYANRSALGEAWSDSARGVPPVVRCPTVDGGCWKQKDLLKILDGVEAQLLSGHVVYLHCFGGHGRAGLVAACMLHRLYGMGAEEALRFVQRAHDARLETCGNHRSPACERQVEQVRATCEG